MFPIKQTVKIKLLHILLIFSHFRNSYVLIIQICQSSFYRMNMITFHDIHVLRLYLFSFTVKHVLLLHEYINLRQQIVLFCGALLQIILLLSNSFSPHLNFLLFLFKLLKTVDLFLILVSFLRLHFTWFIFYLIATNQFEFDSFLL